MTALLAILAMSALFVLSAFVGGRGCGDGGGCDRCHSCGTRWWKENDHV